MTSKERIAIDCEMVASGKKQMPASVALVDESNRCVYKEIVRPTDTITNNATHITGISSSTLQSEGREFGTVQSEVRDLIRGKVVVGHSVDNDLNVMKLSDPSRKTMDVADIYSTGGQKQSLKNLTHNELGRDIQQGTHCPAEDARAAMELSLKAKPK